MFNKKNRGFQKNGCSSRLFNGTSAESEADPGPDPTFAEPLFTQLPAGVDVQLAGRRGVLLRQSGGHFGPRPYQCRWTDCDTAATVLRKTYS